MSLLVSVKLAAYLDILRAMWSAGKQKKMSNRGLHQLEANVGKIECL